MIRPTSPAEITGTRKVNSFDNRKHHDPKTNRKSEKHFPPAYRLLFHNRVGRSIFKTCDNNAYRVGLRV